MSFLNRINRTIQHLRDSSIKEVLAPLLQAITIPILAFNNFSIKRAVDDGYKSTNMVYRCVNVITQNLVTLDFVILDKENNPVDDHPVAILLDNPCPELPPNIVKSIWWKQLELVGSAYIRFVDNPKRPELWPLFPDKVMIVPSTEPGKLLKGYNFLNDRGIANNNVNLLPSEVIHIRQVDPADGLAGVSALRAGFRHVDILSEMDTWNYNSFNNRVLADVVISLKPDNLTKDSIATIRQSIDEQVAGTKNARRAIIAPGATKVDRMSQTAVEMDFTNSKRITREDIAVAYGVPLPVLGIYENGTFANVESAKRDFWEDTLIPKADDFCDTMTWFFRNNGMLKPDQKVGYKKKDIKALQRNYSDRVKDADAASKMFIQTAGYNPEEVMQEVNTLFELGFDMDKLVWEEPEPLELAPELDEEGNPVDPDPDPTKDTEDPGQKPKEDAPKGPGQEEPKQKKSQRDMSALDFHWRMVDRKRNLWVDKFKRQSKGLFSKELELLLATFDGENEPVDVKKLLKVVREHATSWEATFEKLYNDVISDFCKSTKPLKRAGVKDKQTFDSLVKDRIHGYINLNTGLKVQGIRQHTMKKIERIVSDAIDRHALIAEAAKELGEAVVPLDRYLKSEVGKGLKDAYANYRQARALTIARTEVLGAASFGQETAISLSGGQKKEWVSSRDGEVRDSHEALDGEIVDVDESFSNGCRFPGDPAGGPEEVINCRCALVAVSSEEDAE